MNKIYLVLVVFIDRHKSRDIAATIYQLEFARPLCLELRVIEHLHRRVY